jgi:hypothetical protein
VRSSHTGADSDEPQQTLDPNRLFRAGKFRLAIENGDSKETRPSVAQLGAWDIVAERGDVLWDELLEKVIAEYQIQRPARIRAWKAVFGKYGLGAGLPKIQGKAGMAKIIRPFEFCIRPSVEEPGAPEVEARFFSTWFNGMQVVIRDGEVVGFGQNTFPFGQQRPRQVIRHPTLGLLRRFDNFWHGVTRCEPLSHLMNVVDDRLSFRDDPEEFGSIESTLPWGLARGDSDLRVFGAKPPTAAQVKAMMSFHQKESENARVIVGAIYEDYRRSLKQRRHVCTRTHVDERLPVIRSPKGLNELLQLDSINVFTEASRSSINLGFVFTCCWDRKGVGVRWCDGRVEEIGPRGVARPAHK